MNAIYGISTPKPTETSQIETFGGGTDTCSLYKADTNR